MVVISENLEAGSSSTPSTADKVFPSGIRVLLVDDDPICLKDLETILQKNKYEVVAVQDGAEALSTLRKKKGIFDLIITDVHMPRMDGFELLDQIGKEFKIPVIMMSESDEMNVVTRGLERGACFFLLKPVTEADVQNIWQHVYRKKREEILLEMEETGSVRESSFPPRSRTRSKTRSRTRSRNKGIVIEEIDPDSATSSVNEGATSRLRDRKKRKERENDDDGRGDDDDDDDQDGNRRRVHAQKKARVVWNTELHNQFLDAIDRLGIEKAVPKKILELMSIPGLTRENVASHLQKYRLFVKKVMEANQAQEPSTAMSLATGALKSSFANSHSASALLSNIQQRSAGATGGGGGGGLLTDSATATAAATTQRSSLTPSYQPGNSGLLGRSNNNYLTGTTSNNASNTLRTPYGSAGASTSRWFNRTAGFGASLTSANNNNNTGFGARLSSATATAAPQLQSGQPSLTLSNNNNNNNTGLGVILSSVTAAPQLQYGQPSLTQSNNNNNNNTQGDQLGALQPSWLGSTTPSSLYNQQNANVISTGRYPSLSSSGFGMDHQSHYGLRTNGTYYGNGSASTNGTYYGNGNTSTFGTYYGSGNTSRNGTYYGSGGTGTNGTYFGSGGTSTNGTYFGSASTSSRDTALMPNVGIPQQNQLTIGQPRNFDNGPLEHNLNIWNQRQGQLNNTVGAGNLGGSGSSSYYGNINLNQTPLFNSTTNINLNHAGGNSTTNINLNHAGGIQIGTNNLGSGMESDGINQNIGGMFFLESSSNTSNNVNLNYSNLLMTNENLISRNAVEKMPLHQGGQAQGSPSSTGTPTDQTFGLVMNSGYGTQDNDQAAASLNQGANNNQLSASMFITNNAITSEQDYSAPISAPQPEAEHEEEFSEILNLLRSNSAAADELNSLPPLFDEGDLGDFLFKQFDEHTDYAANQQSYGEEVIDPNFDISAYQVDEEI